MTERARRTESDPQIDDERFTVLDDRLLHMTREEAKAYLDSRIGQRQRPTDDPSSSTSANNGVESEARQASLRRAQ